MKNLAEIPERLLMGPGPSNVSRATLEALARPTIGHLDPEFLATMDSLQEINVETEASTSATTESIRKLAELSAQLRESVAGFRLPDAHSGGDGVHDGGTALNTDDDEIVDELEDEILDDLGDTSGKGERSQSDGVSFVDQKTA